jgi:hypothetical protein
MPDHFMRLAAQATLLELAGPNAATWCASSTLAPARPLTDAWTCSLVPF